MLVYVTFLSATTPYLFRIMRPETWFVQGTGNRILYILYDENINLNRVEEMYSDSEKFFMPGMDSGEEERIYTFAEILAKLHNSNLNFVIMDTDAGELALKFQQELLRRIHSLYSSDIYDIKYSFYSRLFTQLLKLCGLKAISRNIKAIIENNPTEIIIEEVDVKWGLKKMVKYIKYFNKILQLWQLRPLPIEVTTVEERARFVLDMLDNGITWSRLRAKTKWSLGTWAEVLKYLWDTERITIITAKRTGTKKCVKIFRKDDEVEALKQGEKIYDWSTVQIKLGLK